MYTTRAIQLISELYSKSQMERLARDFDLTVDLEQTHQEIAKDIVQTVKNYQALVNTVYQELWRLGIKEEMWTKATI